MKGAGTIHEAGNLSYSMDDIGSGGSCNVEEGCHCAFVVVGGKKVCVDLVEWLWGWFESVLVTVFFWRGGGASDVESGEELIELGALM